jgi:hypothetical protein
MLASKINRSININEIKSLPKYNDKKFSDTENQQNDDSEIRDSMNLRNIKDYFSVEERRNSVILTIPTKEEHNVSDKRWFGNTIKESYRMNASWIVKLARFLVYFTIGIAFYLKVEGWTFLNAFYFICTTLCTVGYGNIVPKTTSGQVFTIFYLYIGILIAFSIINEVTRFLVVKLRSKYKKPKRLTKFQVFIRHFINLWMWILILFSLPIFGAVVFSLLENWTFEKAFYFSGATVTTVGFGDVVTTNSVSIVFNCFYMLVFVAVTALALDKVSSFKRHLKKAELWQVLEEITLTKSLIDAVSGGKKADKVSRAEYILHMLQLEGKLDYDHDITRWDIRFNEFDIDEDDYLSVKDVESYNQAVQRRKISESLRISESPKQKENHYYTLLRLFYNETRDVFLETIGYKKETDDESHSSKKKNLPLFSAKILKTLSKQEKEKVDDNGDFELHTIYPANNSGSSFPVEVEKDGCFGINPLQDKK